MAHWLKTPVKQAIQTCFEHAKRFRATAKKHLHLARVYSLHYKVPFTTEQKAMYCKSCGNLLAGSSARVRVHRGRVIRTCSYCKNIRRVPIR